jgi:biopolymer transport protein ExbD
MGNGDYQHSSSGGAAVVTIVAAIVLLLFVGLAVVGVGAFFLMRTRTREAEVRAVMQAEQARAMAEEARATAMVLEAQAKRSAEQAQAETAALEAEATREVIVELNQNGEIQVFGRAVDRDTLKATLLENATDPEVPVTVRLRVDRRCSFGDVADIQSLCHEAGVSRVSLSAAGQ